MVAAALRCEIEKNKEAVSARQTTDEKREKTTLTEVFGVVRGAEAEHPGEQTQPTSVELREREAARVIDLQRALADEVWLTLRPPLCGDLTLQLKRTLHPRLQTFS
jgi:hypothetical protein